MKRTILAAGAAVIAIAGGTIIWFYLSLAPLCGNSVIEEVGSPDGRHRAVLFERSCGATTGFSTHLSVIPASDDLSNDPGNAYVADGKPRDRSRRLQWEGAGRLVVTVNPKARVHLSEARIQGVAIRYVSQELVQ